MIDTETFREWRGDEVADAPLPASIRKEIRRWRSVVYVLHDMELGKWMVVGIEGEPAPDLVAVESYDDGARSLRKYRMPVRFLRLMGVEDFHEIQK